MTQKIKQEAEKWWTNYPGDSRVNPGVDEVYKAWGESHCKAYTAGANFMLEELQKGGEFKEFWVKQGHDTPCEIMEYQPDSFYSVYNEHIHVIDIAALQSANAKIAKLTEAIGTATEWLHKHSHCTCDLEVNHVCAPCASHKLLLEALKSCSRYDEETEGKFK